MKKNFSGGKILVLGSYEVAIRAICKVVSCYGMDLADFDFVAYDKLNQFNFKKLINSNQYTDIFVGPTPHNCKNIDGCSSPYRFLNKHKKDINAKVHQLRHKSGYYGISKETFENALLDSRKFNREKNHAEKNDSPF